MAAACVYGVAVANHSLALLLPPAIALFVLAVAPRIILQWRLIAKCAAVLAVTVVVLFLELPIRAAMNAPLVYGHPDTWSGFQYVVLAEQFRGSLSDPLGDLGIKYAGGDGSPLELARAAGLPGRDRPGHEPGPTAALRPPERARGGGHRGLLGRVRERGHRALLPGAALRGLHVRGARAGRRLLAVRVAGRLGRAEARRAPRSGRGAGDRAGPRGSGGHRGRRGRARPEGRRLEPRRRFCWSRSWRPWCWSRPAWSSSPTGRWCPATTRAE